MGLRLRFTLFFSIVITLLLTGFSFLVFSQVRARLVESAQQSLQRHVAHEWAHLQLHHGHVDKTPSTLPNKEVVQRLWKEGELLFDSFPAETFVGGGHWLKIEEEKGIHGARFRLLAYFDLSSTQGYLFALQRVLWLAVLCSFLITFPLSWVFTRRLLRPFGDLAKKTGELDAETLGFRFSKPDRTDEYGALILGFNSLLARLERSFDQARRFAANASHELRTPLTVIRGEAEVTLRRPRSPEEYQAALQRILDHAESLQRMTTRLLFLTDLERMGQAQKSLIDLGSLVSETIESIRIAYPSSAREIDVSGGSVRVLGHGELMVSILNNLVENAMKYSNGKIKVHYGLRENLLQLEVEDDGPGIPDSKATEVFEPFARHGMPRGRRGHGLGLSIVRSCVEALKGSVELGRSALGGLSVRVSLPA